MKSDNELRDSLYEAVFEEFVGPSDPSSEEILRWVSPKEAYSAGILYPMGSEFEEFEEDDDCDPRPATDDDAGPGIANVTRTSKLTSLTDEDEPIALSNAEHQSAISVSIAVGQNEELTLKIYAGWYEKATEGDAVIYKRHPIVEEIGPRAPPSPIAPKKEIQVGDTQLEVILVYRYSADQGAEVITVALRNKRTSSDPHKSSYKDCYFQVQIRVECESGFQPIPSWSGDPNLLSEEDRSKRLIYRNVKNYAIGHGCAADWEKGILPRWISTEIMPIAETHPAETRIDELGSGSLDMFAFSSEDNWQETAAGLGALCDLYATWIDGISKKAAALEESYKSAAAENISKCRECLERMRRGLSILSSDSVARKSFCMANEAMLNQHLHYSVVSNEATEIREPGPEIRMWRPFQIAFILMNIESMVSPGSDDRKKLDLIWFPTGGGKTEAYLGLSAFALILERLNGEENAGTSVIMRYTLRLLTAQQFDRAASLICALEHMRSENPALLGEKRFSIGLWAGGAASPNTWEQALYVREELRRGGDVKEGGIPVTCCPWCGTKMGVKAEGYESDRRGKTKTIAFVCPNKRCEFSSKKNPLPLKVVDEDIYAEPPSLLLGTVDKFAMIPFRPESYAIFGLDDHGRRVSSPKLIIQDELHLISGPLGSMVAHYETLISELCKNESDGEGVLPKVVASTATVSRAKDQCHELFACRKDDVIQFPPSGIDYDDSFFSKENKDADGRRYVGLYIPNLSYATASIRLYTQLLWTPATWELEDDSERDPYWTVIGYYGTTRELGQAATWADSDIKERLFQKYRSCDGKISRYLNRFVELTGRIDATEVREGLEGLKVGYPSKQAIDLCLATNMISVGLDVPRLGVMVVAGQPKETSEYIQASSRIGRGTAKGMVFVMYGTQRPRDRSHYESFKNYHESFYQHVEPSSITAFCPQVRDRAMAGTVIGMYRSSQNADRGYDHPDNDVLEDIKQKIASRIGAVDPAEVDSACEQIDELAEHWNAYDHARWQELNVDRVKMQDAIPLIYPRGIEPLPAWGEAGFAVPTSMRSVDQECKVGVRGRYPFSDEDDEA